MPGRNEVKQRVADLLAEIEALPGWRVRRSNEDGCRHKHHTIFPPGQQKIISVPGTPGDWRWAKNLRSEIRRAGYDPRSLA